MAILSIEFLRREDLAKPDPNPVKRGKISPERLISPKK